MLDRHYDGVILEDKWGKTYLCSNCLFAYADLGEDCVSEVKDLQFGRYFLQALEPHWNQRDIWAKMYQHAKPWQFDLSKLTTFQLRDDLIKMFAADEMRVWQLTEGWGQPPEDNGIGEGGLAPATSSNTSPAPAARTAKPGGGVAPEETTTAKAASHEAKQTSEPKVTPGAGTHVKMDAHKIYDSAFDPLSTNPHAQYRFSDPSFRDTGSDIYFGENITTSYFEVRKNINGKSLFVGDLEIDGILDLTDENVARSMNVDLAKLNQKVDNPVQQKKVYGYTNHIANQAYAAGYKGILYNSTRKGGSNKAVVLFGGRFDKSKITPVINKPIK
jgi:hypothetical protein